MAISLISGKKGSWPFDFINKVGRKFPLDFNNDGVGQAYHIVVTV